LIKGLLYINGIAAIAVVLNHAIARVHIATFWWPHRYLPVNSPNFDQVGSLSYYGLRLLEQVLIFAIPTFLFVSGFFVAVAVGRSRTTVDGKLIFNRLRNLFIPYVIWSVLIFMGEFAETRTILSPAAYLNRLLFGRADDAFYFVPVLTQLYLFSPFIVVLAKARWKTLLIAAGLLQFIAVGLRYGAILNIETPLLSALGFLAYNWFFPGFIFWFALGVVAGLKLAELKQFLAKIDRRLLITFTAVFFIGGFVEWELLLRFSGQEWIGARETLVDNFYSILVILTYLSFEKVKYPGVSLISSIGTKSYGIYLVHSPVLIYTSKLVYHLLPGLMAYQFLFLPILIILALGIPLALMSGVNRSPVRTTYNYLFG
jgi:membrane-bound acyltransferase YfiQ involved in biofilm formation